LVYHFIYNDARAKLANGKPYAEVMAALSSKQTSATQSSTPLAPATTVSARLEESNPSVRRSSSDSEALTSSDNSGDHVQLTQTIAVPATKPARRTSWLNEVPLAAQRKYSLRGGPLSSSDQAPSTNTSADLSGSINWNQPWRSAFPQETGIWNTESLQQPPPRLSEILSSPIMTNHPAASGPLGDDRLSPISRTISGKSAIPFSIPLHPTPKTYRSQSSSVGQMDPKFLEMMANKSGTVPCTPGVVLVVQGRCPLSSRALHDQVCSAKFRVIMGGRTWQRGNDSKVSRRRS
jgi:hypothetical protein